MDWQLEIVENNVETYFSFAVITFSVIMSYHNFCINHLQIPMDIKFKLKNTFYFVYSGPGPHYLIASSWTTYRGGGALP